MTSSFTHYMNINRHENHEHDNYLHFGTHLLKYIDGFHTKARMLHERGGSGGHGGDDD